MRPRYQFRFRQVASAAETGELVGRHPPVNNVHLLQAWLFSFDTLDGR